VIKLEASKVESEVSGTVAIVCVSGRLINEADADKLGEALMAESDVTAPRLVVNLRGCEILSSASIGMLIRAYWRCKTRNGRFALCEMRPAIAHLFDQLQLNRIFEHYDTQAQALAAIGSP
jgi:anti-anti-sigma factor